VKEGLERLNAFIGKWRGECEVASTPFNSNGGISGSTILGRKALEDNFVFVDEVLEQNEEVTFRSHKVFGYDPRQQVYTLHFFDSDGANPQTRAEGSWEGNKLTLTQITPFGFVRYIYGFTGEEHSHRTEISEDGSKWSTVIQGNYRRLRD